MRRPGIEPGSTAWKAAMLTIIPPTLSGVDECNFGGTFKTKILCKQAMNILVTAEHLYKPAWGYSSVVEQSAAVR